MCGAAGAKGGRYQWGPKFYVILTLNYSFVEIMVVHGFRG